MVTRLSLVCALLVSAATAIAFPYMDGNTPSRAHKGVVIDSLYIPNGRSRGVYLIDVSAGQVRSNMDSTLNLWFNGGSVPRFRRIQTMIVWPADADGGTLKHCFDITIYREGATCQNKYCMDTYVQAVTIPLEADSIRITSRTGVGTNLSLSYVIW